MKIKAKSRFKKKITIMGVIKYEQSWKMFG